MALAVRRHLVSIACLVAAGLIGAAAIADHRNKNARIDRAEVAEWYCRNFGTQCGGPSSYTIERHWNQRQSGYEIVVIALAGFGIARFVYRLARP